MPDLAIQIIQGLTAVLLSIISWWMAQLHGRVRKLEDDVVRYESNVGIGNEKLESLHQSIRDHISREEIEVWQNINLMKSDMGEIKVALATQSASLLAASAAIQRAIEHVEYHDREAGPWKERIVRMETRLDKLEDARNG